VNLIHTFKLPINKQNEELVRAKNSAEDNKRYFQSLFDQSAVSIQIFDTNGLTISANKAWEELWQSSLTQIVGKYNVIDDQSVQGSAWHNQLKKAFEGETVHLPDLEYNPADINEIGRKRTIKCIAFPIKNKGKIEQVVLMHQDISDRKQAEEQLRRLRNDLSNIIDSMPSLIIGVDARGCVAQWNKIAEQATGIAADAARGKILSDVFPRMASEMEHIAESIRNRETRKEIKKTEHTKGDFRYEAVTIYPLIANGVEGAVIRIDDVSKEQELEEQLHHRSKMDAIGQLAGGVAHDFNNMLGGILGAAQLLLKVHGKNLDKKGIDYIELIMQATLRAADLTAKLLAFGRKGKIASTNINAHSIIDDTVAILNRTIDKRIPITVKKGAKNDTIVGDISELQSALMNIGINASHAMPDGGEILIESQNIRLDKTYCDASPFEIESGEYLQIEIRDTGCGIPLENIQRIFEPFYTTKDQGEGTGLGLAAVYGAVQEHHGAINVYSEVGRGTSFHMLLPCSEESVAYKEMETEVLSGSGLILLVDDEEIIRITGRHMLEEMGYQVLLAENGRLGVEIFRKKHTEIDLVIMDMIMPEMNGREAFLKMNGIDPNCKVVIASGFTKNESLHELTQAGLAGFIHKPFRVHELSRLLADVLTD